MVLVTSARIVIYTTVGGSRFRITAKVCTFRTYVCSHSVTIYGIAICSGTVVPLKHITILLIASMRNRTAGACSVSKKKKLDLCLVAAELQHEPNICF